MSWLVYACGAAFFAGITAVLAKVGIKKTDSNLATAIRTVVVFLFACLMVKITGSSQPLSAIDPRSMLFLLLSGLATGASWICYFKALQMGDVNKVTPIDKSSTVLTMLLAFLILHEELSANKIIAMVLIFIGTMMMIARSEGNHSTKSRAWLVYAVFSAVFASLTSILAKIGIEDVNSNLATAVRTAVVLVMAWIVVFTTGGTGKIRSMTFVDGIFICLSGVATGASWLCYYRALQMGQASIVVPIDKLSILVTVVFSCVFLRERLSAKAVVGLILLVCGTLLLLVQTPVLALFGF